MNMPATLSHPGREEPFAFHGVTTSDLGCIYYIVDDVTGAL